MAPPFRKTQWQPDPPSLMDFQVLVSHIHTLFPCWLPMLAAFLPLWALKFPVFL